MLFYKICKICDKQLQKRFQISVFLQQFIFLIIIQLMQTGVAVAVIIGIAIVLVFLFYLVTRYFNYRLQKSLENQNEIYSMVEDISVNGQDFCDGEYQDFALKRLKQKQLQQDERKLIYLTLAGQENLKQSFVDTQFDIYGKKRLETLFQSQPMRISPESSRTNGTLRSFGVQKLSDYKYRDQTNFTSNNETQLKQLNKKKKQNSQTHNYVSQIVLYTNNQIFILKNSVTSIFRSGVTGQVIQKRFITKKKIIREDVYFLDTLEAYGFQQKTTGAYKYQTLVSIPNMKSQTHYPLKQLKHSQSKQQIGLQKFYQILIVLQDI